MLAIRRIARQGLLGFVTLTLAAPGFGVIAPIA
jgi:hypothetical protein